jgi:hypothetical protein
MERTSKFVNEGRQTYFEGKRFSDFCLKIVGEVHNPHTKGKDEHVLSGEGQWLVSTTGFVFSSQYTR